MFQNDLPTAETLERQYRMVAFILFVVALIQATEAARNLVEMDLLLSILKYTRFGLAVVMFPAVGLLIFWKMRMLAKIPKHLRGYLAEPEGYAFEVWKKAMVYSWAATMFTLYALGNMEEKLDGNVELFASSCLAIMLGVFSVSFYVMYRTDGEEDVEEVDAK